MSSDAIVFICGSCLTAVPLRGRQTPPLEVVANEKKIEEEILRRNRWVRFGISIIQTDKIMNMKTYDL